MKWLIYVLMVVLVGASWVWFSKKGDEVEKLRTELVAEQEKGDPDGKGAALESKIQSMEGEKTFSGVLLTFLSAGLVGVIFVVHILPFFAQRVTHAVYDSAEMVEKDVMHDARSLLAQGDYEGAIAAFRQAAAADPMNRLPWVEIAKIYKDNLGDAQAAILTIRNALEGQAWEVNDAAYFLFRLAELYDEVEGDRASAKAIMQQVVDQFPGTRHSANANHKLHEWSVEESATGANAEEEEYLARMRAGENQASAAPVRYELPPADDDSPKRSL